MVILILGRQNSVLASARILCVRRVDLRSFFAVKITVELLKKVLFIEYFLIIRLTFPRQRCGTKAN